MQYLGMATRSRRNSASRSREFLKTKSSYNFRSHGASSLLPWRDGVRVRGGILSAPNDLGFQNSAAREMRLTREVDSDPNSTITYCFLFLLYPPRRRRRLRHISSLRR